jgi:DNA-binding response OmpR family regulator
MGNSGWSSEKKGVRELSIDGARILLIVDNPYTLRMLSDLFTTAGARVFSAPDGRKGLQQFRIHRPDLVILDLVFPEPDGWQVCTGMQFFLSVPVICLSVLMKEYCEAHGMVLGAVECVTKPFHPEVLIARVRGALRQAAAASGQDVPGNAGHRALPTSSSRPAARRHETPGHASRDQSPSTGSGGSTSGSAQETSTSTASMRTHLPTPATVSVMP